MAYLNIDIDLADLETSELIDELERRLKKTGKKGLSTWERGELIKSCNSLLISVGANLPIRSLDDQMKFDHFSSVFEKYTVSEIEKLLP